MTAAERGHSVTLFDADNKIGGQFNLAKRIPGKEEFYETLRYYQNQLDHFNVELKLATRVSAEYLNDSDFDEVIVATGIEPRVPDIDGIDHESVLSYVDVITGKATVGERAAIIGAGGIGFDTAEYLSHAGESTSQNIPAFMKEWGIDMEMNARAGVEGVESSVTPSPRTIYLCQRKSEGLDSSHRFGKERHKDAGGLPVCAYRRCWFAPAGQ